MIAAVLTITGITQDTGFSSSDGVTADNTLKINGVGSANSTVTISNGETVLGTATADATGAWSFTPGLADGSYSLTASETDLAGNTGTATFGFTRDTTAPTVTAALSADTGSSATDGIGFMKIRLHDSQRSVRKSPSSAACVTETST